MAAEAGIRAADVMDPDPPVVLPGTDSESVAWSMVRKNESSVAVVDAGGAFVGLVPPHRMIRLLLAEHDQDVARLGGYLASTASARQATEEAVVRRLWHRLPWLLVGLVGAVLSAAVVGAFEDQLAEEVLLAFFLPGVVYVSAAIGTQTQAVLIRGFSVGISTGPVFRRELISGVLLSAIVAALFVPVALVGWGEGDIAIGVGLALFGSSVVATVVAMILPWAFRQAGSDPAFGSGPLATVLQDILTMLERNGEGIGSLAVMFKTEEESEQVKRELAELESVYLGYAEHAQRISTEAAEHGADAVEVCRGRGGVVGACPRRRPTGAHRRCPQPCDVGVSELARDGVGGRTGSASPERFGSNFTSELLSKCPGRQPTLATPQ